MVSVDLTRVTRVKVGGAEISAFRGPGGLSWAGGAVVVPEVDGTVALHLNAASVPVTVTEEPWASRGTWPVSVSQASLAAGPVALVAPAISGTGAVGQGLTLLPGLWVYDDGSAEPVLTRQWRRDGTAIAGAIGETYTLVAADAGCTITVTETATTSAGSRSATSAGLAVASASMIASGGAGSITINSWG